MPAQASDESIERPRTLSRTRSVLLQPLDHLVEQLWAPVLDDGAIRVTVNPRSDPQWDDVESYWAVPDIRHARLLIPAENAVVAASASTNHRGLRGTRANLLRAGAGMIARAGAPLSRHKVILQCRRDSPLAARALPLQRLAKVLGYSRLYGSTGVRTGANRKPTLSLIDAGGAPVGYAKFGWNDIADEFVRTETTTLKALNGGSDMVRVPTIVGELEYGGHPVVVVEPLPLDARGGFRTVAAPTPAEMFSLAPVYRHAAPGETQHLRVLGSRLRRASTSPGTKELVPAWRNLLDRVLSWDIPLPVCVRWHGDLSPWNRARDSSGRLWLWDWETAQPDALAGLDALHWTFSVQRMKARRVDDIRLQGCLEDAHRYLTAAGVARSSHPILAASYVLTVVERAVSLAERTHSWPSVWIQQPSLVRLMEQAQALLGPRP